MGWSDYPGTTVFPKIPQKDTINLKSILLELLQ